MSLLTLPNELLLEICGLVSPIVMRGTCQHLDTLATAVMAQQAELRAKGRTRSSSFRTITIELSLKSIWFFVAIANHPHLARLVDTIAVRLRPLDLIQLERTEWISQYRPYPLELAMTFSLTDQTLLSQWSFKPVRCTECERYHGGGVEACNDNREARYGLYLDNLSQQKSIINDRSLWSTLQLALSSTSLTNFTRLTMIERRTHCRLTTRNSVQVENKEGRLHRKLLHLTPLSDGHYKFFRPFLKALGSHNNIKSCNFVDTSSRLFDRTGMRQFFGKIFTPLENLERLNIGIQHHAEYNVARHLENWKRLIQACPNLRRLGMSHVPDCQDGHIGSIHFAKLLDDLYFPKLCDFTLSNFLVDPDNLLQFLLRHKKSLVYLELNGLDLHHGDPHQWLGMLQTLRNELKLKYADFIVFMHDLDPLLQAGGGVMDEIMRVHAYWESDDEDEDDSSERDEDQADDNGSNSDTYDMNDDDDEDTLGLIYRCRCNDTAARYVDLGSYLMVDEEEEKVEDN